MSEYYRETLNTFNQKFWLAKLVNPSLSDKLRIIIVKLIKLGASYNKADSICIMEVVKNPNILTDDNKLKTLILCDKTITEITKLQISCIDKDNLVDLCFEMLYDMTPTK